MAVPEREAAELREVVGAILRDLAHARAMGDAFSRELSAEYEKDPLLRLFPVPRSEVRQATITLKFAVEETGPGEGTEEEGVQAKVAAAVAADAALEDDAYAVRGYERLRAALAQRRERLAPLVLAEMERRLSSRSWGTASARRELGGVLAEGVMRVFERDAEVGKALPERRAAVQSRIRARLDLRLREARQQWAQPRRGPRRVLVNVDRLEKVPEAAISSLTLVVEMRNHQWVHPAGGEGQPSRLSER